jgi:hypothetical protein
MSQEAGGMVGPYTWFTMNSLGTTHPVGQKKPNPYGLYDVYGNVAEWVQDYAGNLPTDREIKDYRGPAQGSTRGLRGGAFHNAVGACSSGYRGYNGPATMAATTRVFAWPSPQNSTGQQAAWKGMAACLLQMHFACASRAGRHHIRQAKKFLTLGWRWGTRHGRTAFRPDRGVRSAFAFLPSGKEDKFFARGVDSLFHDRSKKRRLTRHHGKKANAEKVLDVDLRLAHSHLSR